MFTYDKFYDRLFENEQFISLLDNFHSSNWNKKSEKEKIILGKEFVKLYSQILGIKNIKISFGDFGFNGYGGYTPETEEINFNSKQVFCDDFTVYMFVEALFHELRHYYQDRAIKGKTGKYETADSEQVEKWRINWKKNIGSVNNYIDLEEGLEFYMCQPIEFDAYKISINLTKKVHDILKNKIGKDSEFEMYCDGRMYDILFINSNDMYYVKLREKYNKMIQARFDANKEYVSIQDKCMENTKVLLEKGVNNLTKEELQSFCCSYIWEELASNDKVKIMNRLIEMEEMTESIKTKVDVNGNFIVNGGKRYSSIEFLLELYLLKYDNWVSDVLDGVVDCDKKVKDDLLVNLYKINGKEINLIDFDTDEIYYRLQPYGYYGNKFVYECLKGVWDSINNIHGVHDKVLLSQMKNIENASFCKYLEDIYGDSFENIYKESLDAMRENIQEIKKKKA